MIAPLKQIYPSYQQITHEDFYTAPEYYFHLNFYGRQLFITRGRKNYLLKCMSWIPTKFKDSFDEKEFFWLEHKDNVTVFSSPDLFEVVNEFMFASFELFENRACYSLPKDIKDLFFALHSPDIVNEEIPF